MIALVGSGSARDHACALRLVSERGSGGFRFYLTGSNAVMARSPWTMPCADVPLEAVARAARDEGADLVLITDGISLMAGAADRFRAEDLRVIGPGLEAAALESSKALMKKALALAGATTPPSAVATTQADVDRFLDAQWRHDRRFVLKTDIYIHDGALRTIVPETLSEARSGARQQFAALAGLGLPPALIIERRIEGPELSVHVLWDGRDYLLLPPVQDYKRVGDGETGPNTNGAAAIARGRGLAPEVEARLRNEAIEPVLSAIQSLGLSYRGIVYLGVMFTDGAPQVLEINVRPGNPEFLALLGLLESDFAGLLEACADGRLGSTRTAWREDAYCGAVFALAGGYPERASFEPVAISGLERRRDRPLLAEGIGLGPNGDYAVANGRVAAAVATAGSIAEVRDGVLAELATLEFAGKHHRTDLGAGFLDGLPGEPVGADAAAAPHLRNISHGPIA